MKVSAYVFPLALDLSSQNSINNWSNSQAIVIPRGGSVLIPCAVFNGSPASAAAANNYVDDLSNFLTVELVIYAGNSPGGTPLVQKVLPASAITLGVTYAQWLANPTTAAPFAFALTPTDTNQAAGNIYIGIGATTTNAGNVPLAFSSTAKVTDIGVFDAGPPAAPQGAPGISLATAQAMFALIGAAGGGSFAPAVTSAGDGASTSLEAGATTTVATPVLRTILIAATGDLQNWVLGAGVASAATFPDGSPSIILPLDYNASTNAKAWYRK